MDSVESVEDSFAKQHNVGWTEHSMACLEKHPALEQEATSNEFRGKCIYLLSWLDTK